MTHLGLLVDSKTRNAGVEGRNLGNVLILPLTLLLLELERNTTDGTALDTLHQMGREAGDLVAETFRRDNGDLIDDTLVGVEIEGEAGVAKSYASNISVSQRHHSGPGSIARLFLWILSVSQFQVIEDSLFLNENAGRPLGGLRTNTALFPPQESAFKLSPSPEHSYTHHVGLKAEKKGERAKKLARGRPRRLEVDSYGGEHLLAATGERGSSRGG